MKLAGTDRCTAARNAFYFEDGCPKNIATKILARGRFCLVSANANTDILPIC